MGIHFYNIGRRAARVAGAVDALHSHEGRDSHLHGVARSEMFEGAGGESDGVGKRGTAGPRGGIGGANRGVCMLILCLLFPLKLHCVFLLHPRMC